MKKVLIATFICGFCMICKAQDLSFCIQAHEDDWQLFNSKNIISDLSDEKKVVFITLTAGDSGSGNGGDVEIPFFLARERGAVYSAKFARDIATNETPNLLSIPQITEISYTAPSGEKQSHKIKKYTYKNTENYFLRLPDGGVKGNGFSATGNVSLFKLKNGKIASITAVDNSATYNGWSDLVCTIKQIILNESAGHEQAWLYMNSFNQEYSKNDHQEHACTSLAALQAVKDLNWIGITEWMSYHKSKKKGNVSEEEHENAAALFAVYNWALLENGYNCGFDKHHKSWLAKDYCRVYRYPVGNASNGTINIKKNAPIITGCNYAEGSDDKFCIRINVFEKGVIQLKIYNIRGENIFDIKKEYDETGVKELQVDGILKKYNVHVITVFLNDKYFDSKKTI